MTEHTERPGNQHRERSAVHRRTRDPREAQESESWARAANDPDFRSESLAIARDFADRTDRI